MRRIASAAAHRLGRGGEEMTAAVELLVANQPQVGFVNEGGGVERVVGTFRGHARRGELPQFVIDEGEQLGGGAAVAGRGGIEKAGQIGHIR